jgi:hypothetical protein
MNRYESITCGTQESEPEPYLASSVAVKGVTYCTYLLVFIIQKGEDKAVIKLVKILRLNHCWKNMKTRFPIGCGWEQAVRWLAGGAVGQAAGHAPQVLLISPVWALKQKIMILIPYNIFCNDQCCQLMATVFCKINQQKKVGSRKIFLKKNFFYKHSRCKMGGKQSKSGSTSNLALNKFGLFS